MVKAGQPVGLGNLQGPGLVNAVGSVGANGPVNGLRLATNHDVFKTLYRNSSANFNLFGN